jgi:hypothetical protein
MTPHRQTIARLILKLDISFAVIAVAATFDLYRGDALNASGTQLGKTTISSLQKAGGSLHPTRLTKSSRKKL